MTGAAQVQLVDAMRTVESLLDDRPEGATPFVLRPHRPGDIGWVIACHGRLYAEKYGWDETFEALVAEIAARFVKRYSPTGERCWIAERDGQTVGSVFVVEKSRTVAQHARRTASQLRQGPHRADVRPRPGDVTPTSA